MIYLYILKLSDETMYCGISKNIPKRFSQHQCGMCKSTKYKRPVTLAHLEGFTNYIQARMKEVQIKKQGVTRWYNKNIRFK